MSTAQNLPMGEAVRTGWEKFQANAGILIAVQFFAFAIPAILERISDSFKDSNSFIEFGIWIASTAASATVELGMMSIALAILAGQAVKFTSMFEPFDRVPHFVVAGLITFSAVLVGLIFLIVPGILVLIRLQFIGYRILDGAGPMDAIKQSWDLTRGHTLDLFLFGLIYVGINLLGLLCFVVGLLASGPISLIAHAHLYNWLSAKSVAPPAVTAAP